MRRLILTSAISAAALGLAAPSFAATTMTTPDSLPVGVSVTLDPVVNLPSDLLSGGTGEVSTGSTSATVRGLPDPTQPVGPSDPEDQDQDHKDKDKKDKHGRDDKDERDKS